MVKPIYYFFGFVLVISFLFVLVSFIGALIKTKASEKKIHRLLTKYGGLKGNIIASIVGVITPFCSCTTVPIFAGLIRTNVSLGVAMSFLIASPTINIAAFIILLSLFGIKMAFYYVSACFIIAVSAGYILGKIPLKKQIKPSFVNFQDCEIGSWKNSLSFSFKSLFYFLPILILSAAIGALIYNYVPSDFLLKLTLNNNPIIIPVVVLLGAIIYADIILLIPIGYALLLKGVNQGIVFAFMIAASGMSIPQILLLSKILKTRVIIYFILILLVLYTLLGVAFYYI